jgi:hypothetical protein
VAKRKTARKTSAKRSSAKTGGAKKRAKRKVAPRGLNLKKVRADLLLAIEAMKKSPAVALGERAAFDSDQVQLEEMVARINDFCERDKRCGPTMIVPI